MAAQNVSGNINFAASFTETIATGFPNSMNAGAQIQLNQALAYATGATGSVDAIYSAQLTLAAAATHISLASFTDLFGNTQAMLRCRFWVVQNLTLTAGKLCNIYTRTGTNPVTWLPVTTTGALWAAAGGLVMGIDALSITTDGWVVSASHCDFTLDPGANTVSVNVIIAGNTVA
jgi:hypothetical protein